MLTATHIAETLAGQDATNGWDAAYGMNLKQVNALFLQHYLQNGPAHTSVRLRIAMESQPVFWMLEADLGPPKLEFQRERQVATMQMELVRAVLIEFDPDREIILSVSRMRPVESRLTGPLELARTAGAVNQVGSVVADLGATAYTPSITGVDPKSALQTKIADAVKTYFGATNTVYPLGTIAVTNTPACLRPTSFHFWVQQKPGSDDACVLLLVRTNGKEGVVGPLAAYPIPDGRTAALIINKAVVGQLLVERLSSAFSRLGWRFEFQRNGESWRVACVSGDLDFGVIGHDERRVDAFWSANEHTQEAPVRIPTGGFTVEPSAGSLSAHWAPNHTQYWGLYKERMDEYGQSWPYTFRMQSVLSPAFSQSGPPSVDPVKAVVTFGGAPSFTVNANGDPGFIEKIFSRSIEVPGVIRNKLQQEVEPAFRNFQLPSVDAFALSSLLFPAQHAVTLDEAKLPGDLYLAGTLAPALVVTPVDSAVTPGQTVTFQVTGLKPEEVLWKLDPSGPKSGTIDAHGLYSAPKVVKDPAVVVVTAVSRTNASLKGAAMLLLYTPATTKSGFAVSPDLASVTAGQKVELTATDAHGNYIDVNWKPPDAGEIKRGRSHGKYLYTAPDSIPSPREVRAEASDVQDATRTFTVVISLRPSAKVKVSPSGSKVKLGGTLEMTAETTADPQTLQWSVFPIGAGSVSAHGDGKSATYRAPATVPDNDVDVTVFAYSIDDSAAVGIGAAELTLVP